MRFSFLILTTLISLTAFAQTFTGKVTNTNKEPLVGATVVAEAKGNKTIAYCITGKDGAFRLTIAEGKEVAAVRFSCMGYQKKTIPAAEIKIGATIVLSDGNFKLKEVKVKAQRIRSSGDTLTYSVAGFRQGQDRSIADVIAKMPGLEVKQNGTIEYQGKAINKFYIEGLDLMGSQYGMASKNLQADKVKSVQVMENHQAVKSLRGVSFSDQAALNIVLKDEAKAVWTGTADIGLGYGDEFLYDCRLMGMCFNKKHQALLMYKNNNTGEQLNNEVTDLAQFLKGGATMEQGLLSMMSVSTPSLSANRYTFNRSHLLAGNWLCKLSKDSELRLQANGLIDKTKMQSYRSTTYLTLADLPVVTEEQNVSNTQSEWKGEANYQYNGDRTFIKNNVRGFINFNESTGTMLYNGTTTPMSVKPHKRYLTEDFQLSHTTKGGNVYSVGSYWAYNYLPGQLLTINGDTERLNLGFFSTRNNVNYKLKIGGHYMNTTLALDYDHQSIGVALADSAEQSSACQLLQASWSPSMSFIFGSHHLDVKLRLSYTRQSYKQSRSNYFWTDPSVSWNWKATAMSEFSAAVRYSHSPLSWQAIYDTPIFTSYRTVTSNRGQTSARHTLSASATYKYSNHVAGLFFNIHPSFTRSSGNILYESSLNGNVYSMKASDKDYTTQTVGLDGRISKSLGWAKTVIGLSASHKISDYSLLIADNISKMRMTATDFTFDYSLRPLSFLTVEGNSSLAICHQQNRTIKALAASTTRDWRHQLDLHLFPTQKWMISVKNQLFHTSDEGVKLNYFLDLALSCKAKRWELALNANNIIGTSKFERRRLSNDVESYSATILRERSVLIKWSVDL